MEHLDKPVDHLLGTSGLRPMIKNNVGGESITIVRNDCWKSESDVSTPIITGANPGFGRLEN